MHILQANFGYDAGHSDPDGLLDAYRTLTGWAEAMLEAGARSSTVVQRFSRSARVERNGVTYHFCADDGAPVPRSTSTLGAARALVTRLSPDVVHVNGFLFPAATALLRTTLSPGTAIVLQEHADAPPTTRAGRLLRRAGFSRVDALLFAARALAEPWRKAGLIDGGTRIETVMTAGSSVRRVEGAPRLPGQPALLWVGDLNSNKDPLTVLEGFRLALEGMPDAHLTMVYRAAPLLSAVRASVTRERSVAARVHLLGARPHAAMAALFSGADLFVSGSHREGSGNALTEALACGVVPVVTDIPPFQVLTDEGKAGALWRPGDAPGFASALRTVMLADRQALSAKGRKLFASKFSWPAVGARAMQIYRSVVDARRGARRR